jgi:K+-transporting ATPase ATPase C chain
LLTVVSLLLCCIVYPGLLLGAGKLLFPHQAEGSLVEHGGKVVGSQLIAQPFGDDKYFQPRPSAASYNGAASGASNWSGSNYALRDRVAQQLGPIVKYAGGMKKGQQVGPDIEKWFQKDKLSGQTGIVAQWANLHNGSAQNWVKNDMSNGKYGLCGQYIQEWQKTHKADVDAWIKDNPGTPEPKPEDLAVPFFVSFSKEHPGMFPSAVDHKKADTTTEKVIEPVKEGSDIQKIFFDLWLCEHADAELEKVPADAVMASGSGLDPHITLGNAKWQLENQPIAAAWAKVVAGEKAGDEEKSKAEAKIRKEIEQLLQEKSFAPLGGLVGVPLVNVLEVNLALQQKYAK